MGHFGDFLIDSNSTAPSTDKLYSLLFICTDLQNQIQIEEPN